MTVKPLKFGNGLVISPTFYDGCNNLSTHELKLIYVTKKDPYSLVHIQIYNTHIF